MSNILKYKFRPLTLGRLPTELIYATIRLALSDGVVHFSIPAQKHAFQEHPDTFLGYLPFASETVLNPTHVGQAPQHRGESFEVIKAFTEPDLISLVAICLRPSNQGVYTVRSMYPIDRNKLERRIRRRFVVEV